ncbi:hypothetical protein IHV10_21930 [Fictibacillus sp. 5RED26]|uniref:hypothetical protein n=1 Tax=Fictibacillus sp. 5RED26 TaxID=2745876 RepID=UPI0018CD99E0|nr:hypothetical protein [Fictibacillus sp. 5RED26]MBH0159033.1 hypothetical protein [Fictibacillus sp. 5RED26]
MDSKVLGKVFLLALVGFIVDIFLMFVFVIEKTPDNILITHKNKIYYVLYPIAILCIYIMVFTKIKDSNKSLSTLRAIIYTAVALPVMMLAVHYINK